MMNGQTAVTRRCRYDREKFPLQYWAVNPHSIVFQRSKWAQNPQVELKPTRGIRAPQSNKDDFSESRNCNALTIRSRVQIVWKLFAETGWDVRTSDCLAGDRLLQWKNLKLREWTAQEPLEMNLHR